MAISTLKVSANMQAGFKTEIACSKNFFIDQPKAMGGEGQGPNPMEVFLSSLAGCICAIARIIANQQRIDLKGVEVKIEGDIDKDFLLAKTNEGRAGFTEIRTFVKFDNLMSKEAKEEFLHQIAKRCPIADNIANKSIIKEIVE